MSLTLVTGVAGFIGMHTAEALLARGGRVDRGAARSADAAGRRRADIAVIARDLGYRPTTTIDVGVPRFVDWYRGYHGL